MEVIVPKPRFTPDGALWPTLGPQVVDFIENNFTYGPGPLKGEPYKVRDEFRYLIYRAYEHYPDGYVMDFGEGVTQDMSGRRCFQQVNLSLPKGSSKTELATIIALTELHPEAPVRFNGYDSNAVGGLAPGRSVVSPFIPILAPTKEQLHDLEYGAAMVIAGDSDPDGMVFDINKERILISGESDSKIIPVAAAGSRLDGLKPTHQSIDEPLALNTEIPTTEGFKTMAEIKAGDFVFDRFGNPVRVIGKSNVHIGRECFKVTFKNGESVVTDGSHRWKVIDWKKGSQHGRDKEWVKTTKEMLEGGVDTGYGLRWRLPLAKGWQGEISDADIDPYLLGLWLGDGSTDAGYIHSHADDADKLRKGYDFNTSNNPNRPTEERWLVKGWRSTLRKHGFLGNKRIPDNYMFMSREFRLRLLAGLIDSDGYVGPHGNVTFVQGKHGLAEDVRLLAVSLGAKTSLRSREDSRSRTGKMWKVQFCPSFSIPTRLERKRLGGKVLTNTEKPAIASIEPVESVPVQCLEVDSEDHLFLFGRSGYLTHNTHRLFEDRHRDAYRTMVNNLPKRKADDPWQLTCTTAGDPSEPSIARDHYRLGMRMAEGLVEEPNTFFYHRGTSDENARFGTMAERLRALREASGEEAAAFRDLRAVAAMWDDEGNDKAYLERVWCNRWVQSSANAFDSDAFRALGDENLIINPGSTVTLGFDGAVTDDSTALVMTEVATGVQNIVGLWEKPANGEPGWSVPVGEVNAMVDFCFETFDVFSFYYDPPYWQEAGAMWDEKYPGKVIEWPTRNLNRIYYAVRAYQEAIANGEIGHDSDPDFMRHIANAGRNEVNSVDEEGRRKFRLAKLAPHRKYDAAMAAVISWQARLDALKKGARANSEYIDIPVKLR